MPENPHNREDLPRKNKKPCEEKPSTDDEKTQDYYYDDAHGYEIYTDEDEDELILPAK